MAGSSFNWPVRRTAGSAAAEKGHTPSAAFAKRASTMFYNPRSVIKEIADSTRMLRRFQLVRIPTSAS